MMRMKNCAIYLFVTALAGGVSHFAAQSTAPQIFIDHKICPGEGCFYTGETRATGRIDVFSQPDSGASKLFVLNRGTKLKGVDSQVHTVGGRFRVSRSHLKYRVGEIIRVYTYLGEGVFRVWHRGRMFEEDLGFSPWGGSTGTRCQDDSKYCWGKLAQTLDMKWWLKVRTARGKTGWILVKDNLEWLDNGPSY